MSLRKIYGRPMAYLEIPRRSRRAHQILQSLGAVALIQLLLLVSGIVTARRLGPAGRGDVAVMLWLPPIVMQVVCIGFPSALTYFVARGRHAWKGVAQRVIPAVLIQVAVGLVMLFGLNVYFLEGRPADAFAGGLIAMASLPLLIFQYYAIHLVQGLGDIRWFNVLRVCSSGLYSCGIFGASLVGLTVLRCAVVWVLSQALGSAVAATALIRQSRMTRNEPHDDVREQSPPSTRTIRRFAVAGFLAQVSPIESFRLDTLVVAAIFPAQIVGYYSVANSVTNVPLFSADALSAVGYPHVAAESGSKAIATTRRYMKAGWLVCGGTAIVSVALVPVVIPLLFGSAYRPAIETAQLLAVAAALLGLRRIGNDFLRGLGNPGLSTRLELITLGAFAASLAFLGPVGDGRGVAVALIISAGLGLLLFVRLLRRPSLFRHREGVVQD